MRRLQNQVLDEFFDRAEAKAAQYKTKTRLYALISTILFVAYIMVFNLKVEDSIILILLPLAALSIYILSLAALVLVFDVWCIAEMVSPRVLGRYRRFRTFIKILTDSPSRREVLRVTKLFGDILEKNGIENYLSGSEFVKKFYDKQKQQDHAIRERDDEIAELKSENKDLWTEIQEIKTDYMRKFKIQNLKYEQSDRRRITSDAELVKERELRKRAEAKLDKKIQTIGDKAQSRNNSENIDIKKDSQFEEDL